jgi:hypothetical protein
VADGADNGCTTLNSEDGNTAWDDGCATLNVKDAEAGADDGRATFKNEDADTGVDGDCDAREVTSCARL